MSFKYAFAIKLCTIIFWALPTSQSVAQQFRHLPAVSDPIKNHMRKEIDIAIRTTWLKYAHAEYLKVVGQIPLLIADSEKVIKWYKSLKFNGHDVDFKLFVADLLYEESLAFERKIVSFSRDVSHFESAAACDERSEFDKIQLFKLGCLYLSISPGMCFLPLSDDEAFATSSVACHQEYDLIHRTVSSPNISPKLQFLAYSMRFESERLRSEQSFADVNPPDGELATLSSLKFLLERFQAGGECEKYTSILRGMIAEAGVLVAQSTTDTAQAQLRAQLTEKLRDLLALSAAQPNYLGCGTPIGKQP